MVNSPFAPLFPSGFGVGQLGMKPIWPGERMTLVHFSHLRIGRHGKQYQFNSPAPCIYGKLTGHTRHPPYPDMFGGNPTISEVTRVLEFPFFISVKRGFTRFGSATFTFGGKTITPERFGGSTRGFLQPSLPHGSLWRGS